MFPKRRLAAVIAAVAVGAPVASASAATTQEPVITGPSCPVGYDGPTNLATGCPFWMMTYSVEYPRDAALLGLGPAWTGSGLQYLMGEANG